MNPEAGRNRVDPASGILSYVPTRPPSQLNSGVNSFQACYLLCMIFFGLRLKPAWVFESDKKVWRILPAAGMLVVELRDTEKKLTEFVGIELSSGSTLWKNDQMEDKWWTTLNVIYKDTVLLQQFARPDMPTPGKVFVLDLQSGELLWQNQDVSFLTASGDALYCSRKTFTSEEIVGLDFRTGAELEIFQGELPKSDYDSMPDVVFPEIFYSDDENPQNQTSSNSPTHLGFPAEAKQPTFFKYRKQNVLGFYAASGVDAKGTTLYEANLLVTRADGKVLY